MRPGTTINAGVISLLILTTLGGGCAMDANRGDVQYSGSEMDEFFEEGATRLPTLKTRYAVTRLLAAQDRDGECSFVLRKIIEEYPEFVPAYNDLAELYMRHRRIDDAAGVLRAGLRVASEDPVLLNNLGMCALLKGDYESALESFREAAALAPHDARYRANMATALGLSGRYDEALSLYEQVLLPFDAHFNLAVLCEARNDSERAAEEYSRAEALKDGWVDMCDPPMVEMEP